MVVFVLGLHLCRLREVECRSQGLAPYQRPEERQLVRRALWYR